MDWKKFGKVISSNYRHTVILCLENSNKTPKQIAKDSKISFSHISNVLKELKELGLVKCLNPEARKGRIYSLTPLGRKMMKLL